MQVVTPGHKYVLANLENPGSGQTIQFIHKEVEQSKIKTREGAPAAPPKFTTVSDGTTNEEVLAMMLNRLQVLHNKLPSMHTVLAAHHVELALHLLNQRTLERKARGVEGTPQL
jgi:hypothetical protein